MNANAGIGSPREFADTSCRIGIVGIVGMSVALVLNSAAFAQQQPSSSQSGKASESSAITHDANVDVAFMKMSPPKYPPAALKAGLHGQVILLIHVAEDGSVGMVEVEKATRPGVFDAAAIEAAKTWKFRPAMRDGKPVQAVIRVPVDFSPNR